MFLHQIGAGRADRSYGIHVAQLAGVPEPVLRRARELLARLESGGARPDPALAAGSEGALPASKEDRGGITAEERRALLRKLAEIRVETLTPLDALNELSRLRDEARASG